LTTESVAIQHQHRQALRGGIDRGGEARRPGADDDHVINPVRIDGLDETETTGELVVARITQQFAVGAEYDRQFVRLDAEPLDQRLGARIGRGVQPLMRMTVSREKSFEPQDIAAFSAADDDRPTTPGFEQHDAPQDQGAHDPFAELRLFDQEVAQSPRRDDQRLDRFDGDRVDQGRAAGELR